MRIPRLVNNCPILLLNIPNTFLAFVTLDVAETMSGTRCTTHTLVLVVIRPLTLFPAVLHQAAAAAEQFRWISAISTHGQGGSVQIGRPCTNMADSEGTVFWKGCGNRGTRDL